MPYIEKKVKSGKLLEVESYFASRNGRKIARGENRTNTPEDMEAVNQRHAERKLMRLLNTNFSRENGDLFVTLTHNREITEQEAAKQERNVLARLSRMRKSKGLTPLMYIAITERQGRWHHHLVINGGLTMDDIQKAWGERGRLTVSTLEDAYTYEDLAKYLTKPQKTRRGADGTGNAKQQRPKYKRRWHASRNLKQPEVKRRELSRPPKPGEPKARKGYRLMPNWFAGCDRMGYLYSYAAYVAEGTQTQRRSAARAAAERSGSAKAKGTRTNGAKTIPRNKAQPLGGQADGKEQSR